MSSRVKLPTLVAAALFLTFTLGCLDDLGDTGAEDDTDECVDGEGSVCIVNQEEEWVHVYIDGEYAGYAFEDDMVCAHHLQWNTPIPWRVVSEGWEQTGEVYAECDPRPIDVWAP